MRSAATDLVVTGLQKGFGQQSVLKGLDLEVPAGTITAVLGPSGSGKTTLLRVLAGFERPDGGTVTIGGEVVDDDQHHQPTERRHIGYVPQEGSLFPHLNVRKNVGFGLARRQRSGKRVDELLDAAGLDGLAERYPHQLSGGQQQRVALARALALMPRLLLLDEPFASLDANMRATVRADVEQILRQNGTTAILVTHDQDEALSVADLVAVLRGGTIAQVAAPQDLYSHPRDPDLAQFVGEANLVAGEARDDVVVTALGPLSLESSVAPGSGGRLTVLVRPEQIEVHPGSEGPGAPGRVVGTDFYGHDAVVHVTLGEEQGATPVVARVLGGLRLAPGSPVTLTVRGAAGAWPDHLIDEHGLGDMSSSKEKGSSSPDETGARPEGGSAASPA